MFCHKCGSKNERDAKFCAGCGTPLKKQVSPSRTIWIVLGIIGCLFVLVGVGYTYLKIVPNKQVLTAEPMDLIDEKLEEPKEKEDLKPKVIEKKQFEKEKTAIIKEAMPKVFTIFTEEGLGSGFLYKKGGLIVTNAHVVAGYTDVVVRNSNGNDSPGKVIGISDRYDIALIRVKDYANIEPLQVEMEETAVGSEVIALGSPQGFENTASIGYLTGIGRNIEFGFTYENAYQIDAQIDQGSSGGPLLDGKTGKVIGINSLLYTQKNSFGFSIPMYSMVDLVDAWVKSPMNDQDVARLFGVYEEYTYVDENAGAKVDSYFEEFVEEKEQGFHFDELSLEGFILDFRDYYEMALHDEDFYWIQDLLMPGSVAYDELEEYISEISGQGMTFNFISNTVTNIDISKQFAVVTTLEEFDFITAAGETIAYERVKEYTVIIDENGYYRITDIFIYN